MPLKSGGYLIIDQTEAMTTIDVNTGAFVGHRNLEETIFRTNLEAAVTIARQLRLRNLGGIIIIDFIDMEEPEHRRQVIQALEKALGDDHVKTNISSVSPLGLVEMTRKRTRESLEHLLCQACPTCEGRGFVKTAETVCYEVFREIVRQARQFECRQLMVLAHQDVIERLLDEESSALGELELVTGIPIRLQTEALYGVDQYDVVLHVNDPAQDAQDTAVQRGGVRRSGSVAHAGPEARARSRAAVSGADQGLGLPADRLSHRLCARLARIPLVRAGALLRSSWNCAQATAAACSPVPRGGRIGTDIWQLLQNGKLFALRVELDAPIALDRPHWARPLRARLGDRLGRRRRARCSHLDSQRSARRDAGHSPRRRSWCRTGTTRCPGSSCATSISI